MFIKTKRNWWYIWFKPQIVPFKVGRRYKRTTVQRTWCNSFLSFGSSVKTRTLIINGSSLMEHLTTSARWNALESNSAYIKTCDGHYWLHCTIRRSPDPVPKLIRFSQATNNYSRCTPLSHMSKNSAKPLFPSSLKVRFLQLHERGKLFPFSFFSFFLKKKRKKKKKCNWLICYFPHLKWKYVFINVFIGIQTYPSNVSSEHRILSFQKIYLQPNA